MLVYAETIHKYVDCEEDSNYDDLVSEEAPGRSTFEYLKMKMRRQKKRLSQGGRWFGSGDKDPFALVEDDFPDDLEAGMGRWMGG